MPTSHLDILGWDLETSSLNADYGIILCAGFKVVGKGRPEVISIADYPGYATNCSNDKALCRDIAKRLLAHDIWLTQYGTRFDVPFLNTRLLYHGLPPVPVAHAHIDTWRTARYRLKLRNNRLVTMQEFFETSEEKDAVKGPKWIRAVAGHRPSLQYVINHCRKDILVLEEVYHKIRPLIPDHPQHDLDGGCQVCGSDRLQARGYHVTTTNRYRRFHCQACGSWSRSHTPLRLVPRRVARPL